MTTAAPATRPAPSRSRSSVLLAAAGLAGVAALVLALRRGPSAPVPVAATYLGAAAERVDLPPASPSSEPPAAAAAPPAPPIASLEGITPLQGVGVPQAAGTPAPGSASGPVRVAVDTSSARPGVGQPVDLAAHVTAGASGRPRVDGPRFRISGPGIPPGTELTALDDGSGAYRTTFTFLQPGRFDVTFSARADGAVVRGGRALVVEDPNAPAPTAPAPQQASSAVPPAASPQAKWM
ncbi:MAG: hypothetical protein ACRENE_15785 [Polyangiaceae bacterium]